MQSDKKDKRVNVELIDFDDYVYYYENKPYTGVAIELYPDDKLRSELSFYCGLPDGVWRDWYESGQLSGEDNYKLGLHHGLHQEWYPDGQLKTEQNFEYGICVWMRSWNEHNELIEEYKIDPGSDEFKELERMRIDKDKYFSSLLEKHRCSNYIEN